MSNARRPSTARKPPTKAMLAERDAALEEGISLSVDGTVHTVRMGDLSAMDTLALRKEVGMSFMGLMDAFRKDPDIDLIAALVWLSRRAAGEASLSYEAVASELGYDLDVEMVEADEPSPEA